MESCHPPHTERQTVSSDRSAQQWGIAATIALSGALNPTPIPIAGLHKFYLGQPLWGGVYLLLGWTLVPRIACAVEGVWCMAQCWRMLTASLHPRLTAPHQSVQTQDVQAVTTGIRELEQLRQEGLISESEFEQSRRSLLAKLS